MPAPKSGLTSGKIFTLLHDKMGDGALAMQGDDPENNPMPGGAVIPEDAPPEPQPVADAPPEPAEPTPVAAKPAETPAATPDPWADAEEIDYDDTDFDKKYKVKAPKSDAEAIRKGYMRQSDYSKKTAYLGKYKPLFETLVGTGGIETAAAVWELGQQNEAYRNYLLDGYYKAVTGKPLIEQVPTAAQPAAEPTDDDPLQIRAVLESSPLARDVAEMKAAAKQAQTWQAQQYQAAQASAQAQTATYQEFAQRFPGEYTGDPTRDEANMMKVYRYAENSGILAKMGALPNRLTGYGGNPAMLPSAMVMAKYEMDRANAQPPASAALSAAQANEVFERQAREKLAASIGAGGGNPPPPKPKPKPKPQVSNVDARGKLRPVGAVFKDLATAHGIEAS
jgi:hypothetical protein